MTDQRILLLLFFLKREGFMEGEHLSKLVEITPALTKSIYCSIPDHREQVKIVCRLQKTTFPHKVPVTLDIEIPLLTCQVLNS